MTTHVTTPCLCPWCGAHLTRCTNTDASGTPPDPGDFTVCISCIGICQYGADLQLARATEAVLAALDEDVRVHLYACQVALRVTSRPARPLGIAS